MNFHHHQPHQSAPPLSPQQQQQLLAMYNQTHHQQQQLQGGPTLGQPPSSLAQPMTAAMQQQQQQQQQSRSRTPNVIVAKLRHLSNLDEPVLARLGRIIILISCLFITLNSVLNLTLILITSNSPLFGIIECCYLMIEAIVGVYACLYRSQQALMVFAFLCIINAVFLLLVLIIDSANHSLTKNFLPNIDKTFFGGNKTSTRADSLDYPSNQPKPVVVVANDNGSSEHLITDYVVGSGDFDRLIARTQPSIFDSSNRIICNKSSGICCPEKDLKCAAIEFSGTKKTDIYLLQATFNSTNFPKLTTSSRGDGGGSIFYDTNTTTTKDPDGDKTSSATKQFILSLLGSCMAAYETTEHVGTPRSRSSAYSRHAINLHAQCARDHLQAPPTSLLSGGPMQPTFDQNYGQMIHQQMVAGGGQMGPAAASYQPQYQPLVPSGQDQQRHLSLIQQQQQQQPQQETATTQTQTGTKSVINKSSTNAAQTDENPAPQQQPQPPQPIQTRPTRQIVRGTARRSPKRSPHSPTRNLPNAATKTPIGRHRARRPSNRPRKTPPPPPQPPLLTAPVSGIKSSTGMKSAAGLGEAPSSVMKVSQLGMSSPGD